MTSCKNIASQISADHEPCRHIYIIVPASMNQATSQKREYEDCKSKMIRKSAVKEFPHEMAKPQEWNDSNINECSC